MIATYRHLVNKWTILVTLLAVLAMVLAVQPAWGQDAAPTIRDAQTVFDYDENGSGPITTFRASDPENKPVFWTLGGADAADFTIDGGTLRFKSEPNYEVPTDRHDDTNNDGTVDAGEDVASNNAYRVTVRVSAGGEDGAPAADAYDGDDLDEIDLTVNVINVNEPGSVVISPMQPQVGTMLTAILSDEDNVAPTAGEWQWARADSMNGPFTDIPALSTGMDYRPTIDDLGKYLQVTVVYVDRAGADPRTVQEVSAYPVREDVVTSNQPPKYPDQKTLIGGNDIVRGATDRFIPETAAAGTNVGAPVTAFDDKTDIEVLTYSLLDPVGTSGTDNTDGNDDDTNPDTPSESDGHAASFDIDEVTGQITVGAGAELDADAQTPTADNPNPYTVVVRAVDGDGHRENITVTIHVLKRGELPRIDRTYATGRVPTGVGVAVGDRAPTEMSHYESDRINTSATTIDTNLDTAAATTLEPAAYYATDPDGDTINWSLAGPDAGAFIFEPTPDARPAATDAMREKILDGFREATGETVTLAFRAGPDHETPGDANRNRVYEVTIVVTDGTGLTDELDVTVKVINSTDDNKAGKVSFSNRQPEVATALTASFEDDDTPIRELKWQWYRAATATAGTACVNRTPATGPVDAADGVNDRRYFVENDTIAEWVKITGATSASYTPEAVFGADGTTHEPTSDFGKCLRATVTYRDAVDRTHSGGNDNTTDVDETLEATWAATEQPVKVIDEENDAPVFTVAGALAGASESTYRSEIVENTSAPDDRIIDEAHPAVDPADGEDDDSQPTADGPSDDDDLLTYSLSGRDASSFTITGTIDHNSVVEPTDLSGVDDGRLTIAAGLDYETQREYRVRITATDPSGDSDFVDVIVNVTGVNEPPTWVMNSAREVYAENGTANVSTYLARDAEVPPAGITYSLVTAAVDPDGASGNEDDIEDGDIADRDLFKISSIGGQLSFKASPNYEDPQDTAPTNMYQVAVKAEVADDKNPRDVIYQKVTVIVTNVNEAPVFSETTDALQITENPDDPEKEPPLAAKYLYLLNRGVGKPAADLPAEPSLDVGIPIVAVDDDNTFTATNYTTSDRTSHPVQLIDGLTYELSGADAGPFHIVPATGQILTLEKLDYEAKNEYKVTVTAEDPSGLKGSINLTISVIDVDETPIVTPDPNVNQAPVFSTAGTTRSVAENTRADQNIGAPVTATDSGDSLAYSLSGTDASSFSITSSTGQLRTKAALDYETKRSYSVVVTATDSGDLTDTITVTINVTDDVNEPDPDQTLLERYDVNDNEEIDLDEVFRAVDDYFDYDNRLTLEEINEIVDLYFEA